MDGWMDAWGCVCLILFFFFGGGGGKLPKSTHKHDAHNQPIKTKKKVLATLDAGTSEWVLSCGAAAGDGDGLTEEEREVLSLASTSTRPAAAVTCAFPMPVRHPTCKTLLNASPRGTG